MAVSCIACSRSNVLGARYCEGCGAPLEQMVQEERRVLVIGSDPESDLILDHPAVSPRHARLDVGELVLEDTGSRKGTFIGNRRVPIMRANVVPEDVVFFGEYRTTIRKLLAGTPSAPVRERMALPPEGRILIGRSPDCEVFLDHPVVAPHQCLLDIRGNRIRLSVLSNELPVYLSGDRIIGSARVEDRSVISLGPFDLLRAGENLIIKQARAGLSLEIREVSLTLNPDRPRAKTLLENVSLTILPGEFCGLMGLAGAGKSTLIKVCCGYRSPTDGSIRLDSHDFYRLRDRFKTSIGYVPQENILFKDLTVGQSLDYAARLRLGTANQHDEQSFHRLLARLGVLETNPEILETRVSSISGGQKRAVSIAIEMLADPAVFFLDEPTSGLSSEEAYMVMGILRRMADQGKTILISLHQPNSDLYEMLDNVVYLHKGGRLVYYGPTVPDSITFTDPTLVQADSADIKPERVLHMLERESADVWQQRYQDSYYHADYVASRRGGDPTEKPPEPATRTPPWRQAWVLFRRNVDLSLQDTLNSLILFLQAPVIAGLIAMVFSESDNVRQNAPVVLYLMVVASVWFGCSNASRDICGEWSVYLRERMFNMHIIPYVCAKMAVGAMVCAIQCFVLTAIVRHMCGLDAPFWSLLWLCTATATTGTALGLLISSFAAPFAKSNEIALALVPIVLLPMVILGGVIRPYKDMNPATQSIAEITVTHWAFQAAIGLEADAIPTSEKTLLLDGSEITFGDWILEMYREAPDEPNTTTCLSRIFMLMVVFTVGTIVLLRFRDPR